LRPDRGRSSRGRSRSGCSRPASACAIPRGLGRSLGKRPLLANPCAMLPRMAPTFLWHDYETTGADPRRDRPAQFAAIRTTPDLEPVGEPVAFHCKPAPDVLPHPEACLITGITPQLMLHEGVIEA